MSSVEAFLARTHIAYFSMEIAIRPEMYTYAGGLGILAGDTARSCADLELPVVFVSLLSRAGYFRQEINAEGRQIEHPDWWDIERWCTPLNAMVAVEIETKPIWVRPWLYIHTCPHGHQIPILLLDTQLDQNAEEDRAPTHYLYGGDDPYRLKQEIILGIGGIRILRALGFDIHTYHLNEGHAAVLSLDLLNRLTAIASGHPIQVVIAGKAHPRDEPGKEAIRRLHEIGRTLQGKVTCVFLPDYDMQLAMTLVAGSDVWLNTPLPPLEASGTSGMKAALNGVLNLSVLDGWWIEACIEGVTGWSIGDDSGVASDEHRAATALYDKLEHTVVPLYGTDPARWRWMMKQTIGNVAFYFNSQRMMRRYATEAYLR